MSRIQCPTHSGGVSEGSGSVLTEMKIPHQGASPSLKRLLKIALLSFSPLHSVFNMSI